MAETIEPITNIEYRTPEGCRDVSGDVYIFGSVDPESERGQRYLHAIGARVVQLTLGGEPVSPRDAYSGNIDPVAIEPHENVFFFECEVPGVEPMAVFDHHKEGDPGYEKSAKDAVDAAALAQLLAHVNIKLTDDDKVLAAMDHNYAAAMRGEVPGVSREAVFRRAMHEIHRSSGKSMDEVRATVDKYRDMVQLYGRAKEFASGFIHDMRSVELEPGFSFKYLCVRLALGAQQRAGLVRMMDGKHMLVGNVSASMVEEYIDWATQVGMVDVFGVPERGYAGSHLPPNRLLSDGGSGDDSRLPQESKV